MFWTLAERANYYKTITKLLQTITKLRTLVEIYLFSWEIVVFVCGFNWVPGKMIPFFFTLNKLTGRYLQWPCKLRCSVE